MRGTRKRYSLVSEVTTSGSGSEITKRSHEHYYGIHIQYDRDFNRILSSSINPLYKRVTMDFNSFSNIFNH